MCPFLEHAIRIDIDKELEKVDEETPKEHNKDVRQSTFKPDRIAQHIDTEGRFWQAPVSPLPPYSSVCLIGH